MRKPTGELQEEDAEFLVGEKMKEAYQWYLECVKALLDWKQPALEKEEFEETMEKLVLEVKNYFRTLFIQGTTGENVPFSQIEKNEKALVLFYKSDFALFRYCNKFKSFTLCSGLKRELIKNHSAGKTRLLRLYDRSAQGYYAKRCREDLEQLLTLMAKCRSQKEVTCKLEAQLAMDHEILAAKLAKAQEKARTQISEVFSGSEERQQEYSSMTKTMLLSHTNLMDVITRVIESAPESSNQSFVLSGSLGSLRDPYGLRKHCSEEAMKRPDSMGERDSQLSEINSPLEVETSQRPKVLCMDSTPLRKLA
jgi:hypothetical protein